jgi:SAM-dependent methyltransferase
MQENARRVAPRLWDTDWLQLRPLARLLREKAKAHLRPGGVMIDLGCGTMPYAGMMRDLGWHYQGADIDADAVGVGEAVAHGKLPIDPDGRVPFPDHGADAVISVQVLEHIADLDSYCAEIRRLLAPGGLVLLSTHGSWFYHPHPEDHRRWTRTGLKLDLEARGIMVEEMHSICGPLATTTMIRLTAFAFVIKRIPLVGKPIAGLLSIVMNLRGMVEDAATPAEMRDDNACIYLVRARVAA